MLGIVGSIRHSLETEAQVTAKEPLISVKVFILRAMKGGMQRNYLIRLVFYNS